MTPLELSCPQIHPVFDIFVVVAVAAAKEIPTHQHTDYEFIYAVEGHYHYTHNNREGVLAPGQGLILKPGDLHSDSFPLPPVRYLAINFRLEAVNASSALPLFAAGADPSCQVFKKLSSRLTRLLRELMEERHDLDFLSVRLRQALLQAFFWLLVRTLPREAVSPGLLATPSHSGFRTALEELFQMHPDGVLDVDGMAAHLRQSRRSFSRLCRQIYGQSPARVYLQYRMDRARKLLLQTEMSIKEISAYLGFSSPYHFSATFKRMTNRSPRSFRTERKPR